MSSLHRALALLALAALAVLLSLALSSGALAGTLFQSSPPPVLQPTPGLPVPPTTAPVMPPVTQPTAPPVVIEPTATPSGFLPAPTLTSPGLMAPAQPAPEAVPPLTPYVEPTPPPPPRSTFDTLVDAAVETLGYVWLCCGGILLVAAVAVFVWLSRRTAAGG